MDILLNQDIPIHSYQDTSLISGHLSIQDTHSKSQKYLHLGIPDIMAMPLKMHIGTTYIEQKDCTIHLLADNIDFGQTKGKIDQTNT